MPPEDMEEERKEIMKRQARIDRLEREGYQDHGVPCPCCNRTVYRLVPNVDGVLTGVECAKHSLHGCRKGRGVALRMSQRLISSP